MVSIKSEFLPLLCLISACLSQSTTKCYSKNQGTINLTGAGPCGKPNSAGFVQCCAGSDVCGSDGFCHFDHALSGGSGYYMGSCTDPTFSDPTCPQHCSSYATQDTIFNSRTGLWACCYGSSGKLDCANPGSETWQSPGPKDLFAAAYVAIQPRPSAPVQEPEPSSAVVSSAPTTIIARPSPSSTSSSVQSLTSSSPSASIISSSSSEQSGPSSESSSQTTQSISSSTTEASAAGASIASAGSTSPSAVASSDSGSAGLSTGAKAGIGVGVAIVVVGLVALAAYLLLRKSRRRSDDGPIPIPESPPRQNHYNQDGGSWNYHPGHGRNSPDQKQGFASEMPAHTSQYGAPAWRMPQSPREKYPISELPSS